MAGGGGTVTVLCFGSSIEVEGRGAALLLTLSERLQEPLGTTGRWIFLFGAFGAVFSSLLGVWQAVPYIFAGMWRLFFQRKNVSVMETRALPYRAYLFGIALAPMAGLLISFREVQKLYTIIDAAFMPLLAISLLILNGRRAWTGNLKNSRATEFVLLATLLFFG